jgi:hypothetical protein
MAMEERQCEVVGVGRRPGPDTPYLDQVEETKCIYLHIGLHHFVKQRIGLRHKLLVEQARVACCVLRVV